MEGRTVLREGWHGAWPDAIDELVEDTPGEIIDGRNDTKSFLGRPI